MKLNEIENIILDLRFNTGGYSKHIYDFLGFFDIENYKELLTYTRWVYRLREEAYPEKNEENSYLMIYEEGHKNLLYYRHTDTLFDGNLYVLTGSESFSLGSWLPAIVKDNNIGMVIGEPTANASVSHGTSKSLIEGDYYKEEGYELILPLSLTVRTLTLKLDQEELKNEPDAVYPHIPVKTTIDHLIKDVDPCWNYILEELVKDPTP